MYMQFLKNIRLRLTDSTKYVKLFSENLCGKQMKQKAETFLRILGIDPGLATMGWGVIEADGYREKLVQYGALITYPRDTFPTRLRCIYTGVQGLLQTFKPDEIAFEELFFSKNVTTGIQVGGARWRWSPARPIRINCLNIRRCRSSRRSSATAARTSIRFR